MNQIICDAIRNKRLLSFNYHGHPRTVEPHTYGIDTKGHLALRAFQVSGSSSRGGIPDWRIFHESDILGLSILESTFANARSGYVHGDSAFSTIQCQLQHHHNYMAHSGTLVRCKLHNHTNAILVLVLLLAFFCFSYFYRLRSNQSLKAICNSAAVLVLFLVQ